MNSRESKEKAGSSLCRQCGLCCDGSLFGTVPLSDSEAAVLRAAGLHIDEGPEGRPTLRQPCVALTGKDCRSYADRPTRCREFRCLQLQALMEGEVDLEGALSVIGKVHELIGGLRQSMGEVEANGAASRARAQVKSGLASDETKRALEELESMIERELIGRTKRGRGP